VSASSAAAPAGSTPRLVSSGGQLLLILVGVYAVFWSQFAWVRHTNFEGFDEWFVLSMTRRGIIDVPVANRPFGLVWNLTAAFLAPDSLLGAYLVHAHYLVGAACLTSVLCLRLVPGQPLLAFLAGALTATWVPLDLLRLAGLYGSACAGMTFGIMLALLLLVESRVRGSFPLLGLAALLAYVNGRSHEGTLPLLSIGPLLLLAVRPRTARPLWPWVVVWVVVIAVALAGAALPLVLGGSGAAYQRSLAQLDLSPAGVLGRLELQYWYHLWPLVSSAPGELAELGVLGATAVLLLFYSLLARRVEPEDDRARARRALALSLVGGLAAAGLGYAAFVLSAKITMPRRTQFFASPGIGLAIASASLLVASLLRGRGRRALPGLLAAWVVAVGTGRTLASQRFWDQRSYFAAQNRILVRITELAPDLESQTLVVLADETGSWPGVFSFRHAIEYLYDGRAIGHSWPGWDIYYPASFERDAIRIEPWESIRVPWASPVTRHPCERIVVFWATQAGEVRLLEQWPTTLLPLDCAGRYDPGARVRRPAALPASRRILDRPATAGADRR
jgi:hypothetical protein